jgi:hypothetical protein
MNFDVMHGRNCHVTELFISWREERRDGARRRVDMDGIETVCRLAQLAHQRRDNSSGVKTGRRKHPIGVIIYAEQMTSGGWRASVIVLCN